MYSSSNSTSRRRSSPLNGTVTGVNRTVVGHCRENWIPSVIELPAVMPDNDSLRDYLIEQCRLDPLLLLSIIRVAAERFDTPAEQISAFLVGAPIESLQSIYAHIRQNFSKGKFNNASPIQGRKMQQVALAVGGAKVLSEQIAVEHDKGFLVAALPQLGHLLYSWNYPTLYASSIAKARRGNFSLDVALEQVLSLKPAELVSRITRSWRISRTVSDTLEERPAIDTNLELIHRTANLLAAQADPHCAPNVREEFEELKETLYQRYSIDVEVAAKEQCFTVFDKLAMVLPRLVPTAQEPTQVLEDPFQKHFAETLQPLVRAITKGLPELSLSELLPELFVKLGCTTTCLYRYESHNGEQLVPLLCLSPEKPKQLITIAPLSLSLFADCIYSQTTRLSSQGALYRQSQYWSTAPIMIHDKMCVLYVEFPQSMETDGVEAIVKALSSCALMLKDTSEKLYSASETGAIEVAKENL